MTLLDPITARRKLLAHLHRGGQFAYWWTSDDKQSAWWPVARPTPLPAGKVNTFFGIHPVAVIPEHQYQSGARMGQRKPKEETRAKIDDVCAVNCLFAELDAKDFADGKSGALATLIDMEPPASVVIDSGGGYHAYWLLARPFLITDDHTRAIARDTQARWVAWTGGDKAAKDLARVLRVPGTRNYKDKYAPDYPEVSFVWYEETLYSLEDLQAALPAVPEPESVTMGATASSRPPLSREQAEIRATRYAQAALFNEALRVASATSGTRHDVLYKAAAALGGLVGASALNQSDAENVLWDAAQRGGFADANAKATLSDGLAAGVAHPRVIPERASNGHGPEIDAFDFVTPPLRPTPSIDTARPAEADHPLPRVAPNGYTPAITPDPLPAIQINNRHMRDITQDVTSVLERQSHTRHGLFVRGGMISRVKLDERGRAAIEMVDEDKLTSVISRSANFFSQRISADGPFQRVEDVPQKVIRDIMALGRWPALAPVDSIIESPTMRPDGTILDTPGYDAKTALYYAPAAGFEWPGVPTSPTRYQVERALEMLMGLVSDFPFINAAARANWLGLFMTSVLRPAIYGHVPMALIDATGQGTGKTMLSELPALLATGVNPTLIAMPYTGEEWIKTITTTLMSGHAIVVLDNIGREVYADELAQVLTSDIWTCRLLGTNLSARLPHRMIWVANGNNIKVRGDFSSRCYWIRLEAKTSRPWERTDFRIADIKSHIATNRGEIIAAVLTIARAWFAAGQPARETPVQMRTFTEWARVIGGSLEFAGERGFLANAGEFYDSVDEEAPQWESFLKALYGKFPGTPFTIAQVCAKISGAFGDAEFAETFPEAVGEPLDDHGNVRSVFKTKLGKQLARRIGTRYGADQIRVERDMADTNSNKSARWRVMTGN